ncbi:MAG: phosphatidylserine decarboxylase [Planctomycetota bacterium]|jgi:phosphatidylserine decarboxylase
MRFTKYGTRELVLFGIVVPGIGLAGCAALALLVNQALWFTGFPFVLLFVFILNFFRDPNRPLPGGEFTVVSPADGKVTDVGEREDEEYFKGTVQSVGIFLSVFDVHVNRSPLDGTVDYLRHQDGVYKDARDPEASTLNEAQNIGFKSKLGPRFLIRQITGLIARRIVCPLKEGDEVTRGERFGMLKFGSRTELWFDNDFEVDWKVTPGANVLGGQTVLAVVKVKSGATTEETAAASSED